MVPTMFVRMLKLPEEVRAAYDMSSLRLAVHAAAPCPVEVKQAMIDWWGPIVARVLRGHRGQRRHLRSAPRGWLAQPRHRSARPLLGTLHICDDDGNELPAGEVGTIYFERDDRPFTYHNDPRRPRDAAPRARDWSTVGDLGYLDDDGYLFLTDRKAFMIISGGVNIYPQEVEDVLTLHPKIFDVAVIGVPDDEMGEQVKAVVQLRDGVTPSDELAAEIIGYVRERLAHFKAPRSVDFIDELPRSATGKLVKRKLQERYVEVAT